MFFAAMLHSHFVPHIVGTVPQNWRTVVNHYYTQVWGLTMCFLRQCCTHCLCPTLWSSQFWSIETTMRGTNCECSIAAKHTWLDPSFVCNNDLPQSNHDFCTKAAWPRPSQFWGTVATMWGTNSECSIAAKKHMLRPQFCV